MMQRPVPRLLSGFLFGAVLLLSPGFGHADPMRHGDLGAKSAWAAHLDVTKLRGSALESLLRKAEGFDRLVELQQTLDEEMSLDLKALQGVTIFAAGKDSQDTAVVLRGNFENANLSPSDETNRNRESVHRGHSIYEITKWRQSPVFLARRSKSELAGGTSPEAAREVLDLLDGQAKPWSPFAVSEGVRTQLASATVSFVVDVERLGKQLQFEAEFTRSLRHAWFLIGSQEEDVQFTTLINSRDAESLLQLRQQFQGLLMMLSLQEDLPEGFAEMLKGVQIETRDHWMTLKVAVPPEKAPQFLKSLGGMFREKSKDGEGRRK